MKRYRGIGASDGIAVGPAHKYLPELPALTRREASDTEAEVQRLETAVARVVGDLGSLVADLEKEVGREDAMIFEAHQMFLSDPAFIGRAKELIREQRMKAEIAIEQVMDELQQRFQTMEDEYFRERAMDVMDVGRRLLCELLGLPHPSLRNLPGDCVIVAKELTPSDTARMDRSRVLGFCTARGGKTAHAAILARSLGIPAVVGAGDGILGVAQGCAVILDGIAGDVIAEPDEPTLEAYARRRTEFRDERDRALAVAREPATSRDGRRVEVVANIGSVEEARAVIGWGGEGVGLLRTEFLFLDRATAPDEDEQTAAYSMIAEALGEYPLIIRTLDIGGDKPLAYLRVPKEDNPFLGHRGIRLCLAEPEMFKVQLRAILRAAAGHNVKVMFPMVGTAEEIRGARALLEEARRELDGRGIVHGKPEVGIMVEIPAAAVAADNLARLVDFFSIGTNDLTQYTLAADRTNDLVQNIADALHPAVLRLVAQTISQGHEAGIWVGVCGELAGDPLAAPILLGLDLDEFSMAPSSIPAVKGIIRQWSYEDARSLAAEVLRLDTAGEVRERVQARQPGR